MRIEQITFTRSLAAFSMIIYHYGLNIYPFNTEQFSYIFKQADVGVSFFYLLSGFVMMFAYGKKSTLNQRDYFKARFARVYPVYLLAILLVLIHYTLNHQNIDYTGLFLNILAVQAWVPAKAISFNSPAWSLAVEFFFYAAFPFTLKYLFTKTNFKKTAIAVIIFWLASQVLFNLVYYSHYYKGVESNLHNFLYYFPIMHLSSFLIGTLAGYYFLNINSKVQRNYDLILIFIVALLIVILKFPTGLNYHNGLLAVIFVPFIILLSLNNGAMSRLFNKPAFVFLGEISYSMYILQYPVFTWVRSALKQVGIRDDTPVFYISLSLLVIISGISYRFIETPLRTKIKNFSFRRVDKALQ